MSKAIETKLEEIQKEIQEKRTDLKKLGLTEDNINRFLLDKKLRDCPYCDTHNMYVIHNNKEQKFEMYECDSCRRSYLVNY